MSKKSYVLDSYALLCFFEDEKGAEIVEALLHEAQNTENALYLNVINLAEIYYSIERRANEAKAIEIYNLLQAYSLKFVEVDAYLALVAAKLKAKHPIALGDCFCAATAKVFDATVVTGDPEFKSLEGGTDILWLPPKPKK